MSYARPFLVRWTRRDWLAVLVVAATVVFLTGTTLFGMALATQTTAIAADFPPGGEVTQYESPATAHDQAPDAVVFPVTTVTIDDEQYTVVGIPTDSSTVTAGGRSLELPAVEAGVLAIPGVETRSGVTVNGVDGAPELTLTERTNGQMFPTAWGVTTAETVGRVGATGALAISQTTAPTASSRPAAPLVGALRFFVLSTGQLVRLLQATTVAAAAMVLVTVYSVTSITVVDRSTAIRVVRATGGSARRVRGLFAARGGLLTLVGVALGYAGGLILARALVNGAVFLGVETTLNVHITDQALRLLATAALGLGLTGTLSGWIAARGAVRGPQLASASMSAPDGSVSRWLSPTVLDWDALIPSTTTLTVFVAFVLVITALGATVAPLAAADEQTITEPGAPHPVASSVPQWYAPAFRAQGATVSPEILLFLARGGEPFVARGVNYTAYAELSGVRMVSGRAPTQDHEAAIGQDLAAALDVGVGDHITVGGSTKPAVAQVEIVGRYAGDGPEDDQLLMSLDTARPLAGKSADTVHFVRVSGLQDDSKDSDATTVLVSGLAVSRADNGTATVTVQVVNLGLSEATRQATVSLGNRTTNVTLRAPGRERATATASFRDVPPGTYAVRAGNLTRNVTLTPARVVDGLRIAGLPERVPPDSNPVIRIVRGETAVANATVTVAGEQYQTAEDGAVRVRLSNPGEYTVTAEHANGTAQQTVQVAPDTARALAVSMTLDPMTPTIFSRPVVAVQLGNPWAERRNVSVRIASQGTERIATVAVPPGGTERITLRLPRRPGGTYTVNAQVGDRTRELTYQVQGDERLATALASSGRRTQGSGISQAVELVFGNLRVLLAALVVLAGVMVGGGTTASFARSIAATRRSVGIRRAMGARPRDIYRLVLGDALRVGGLATLAATVIASLVVTGLLRAGELRLFGVGLRPEFSPVLLLGAAGVGLTLALVSAALAALPLVRRPPADLFRDREQQYAQKVDNEKT